jgi:hypothetical protein
MINTQDMRKVVTNNVETHRQQAMTKQQHFSMAMVILPTHHLHTNMYLTISSSTPAALPEVLAAVEASSAGLLPFVKLDKPILEIALAASATAAAGLALVSLGSFTSMNAAGVSAPALLNTS